MDFREKSKVLSNRYLGNNLSVVSHTFSTKETESLMYSEGCIKVKYIFPYITKIHRLVSRSPLKDLYIGKECFKNII